MSTSTPIKKPISIGIDFYHYLYNYENCDISTWLKRKEKSNPNPLIKKNEYKYSN
jgi:hypothetical protein